MNPGWRILDLTTFSGSLTYVRGRLKAISTENDTPPVEVPLSHIAVVLVGVSTSISGALLTKLAEYDVAVMVCDWKNVPQAAVFPWSSHTRVGARQLAQARMPVPRMKSAWAKIIQAKVRGQANNFKDTDTLTASKLRSLAQRVRSGDPDNIEAQAARLYWNKFAPDSDFHRTGGVGADPINAALDYGYSVLRGYGVRAVLASGLCASIGVFHRGRSNPFNLVDDLIEPFRPAIDHAVADLDLGDELPLSRETRTALVAAADCQFLKTGESISTVFQDFAQSFGLYAEGESSKLSVPTWQGPF